MRAVLVSLVAAVMAVTACSSSAGSAPTSPSAPPTASAEAGPAAADAAAKVYDAAVAKWTHQLTMQTAGLSRYPEQISLQHDTAKQLTAQRTDCRQAAAALAGLSSPPTLAAMPASGSTAYTAAATHAKALAAATGPAKTDLRKYLRFCTWLDALEQGELQANAANTTLFTAPYRYSGTTTIDGVSSSCAAGATCFTPDQKLWPTIARLWRRQGSSGAAGAHQIQQRHVPCLLTGWDAVCLAVVKYEVAYRKWTDEYAAAFDKGSTLTSVDTATANINQVGAAYTDEVITPTLTALTSAYAKLVPPQKYRSNRSLIGEDLWIRAIRPIVKSLGTDLTKVAT